ncbi:MAG: adenylate/guanylate cyclase domain-containing protein [Lachnospiraceae bacterium]|nr:adenylate/guanylate cyclase domain-containing protein [Lachnospiraceae bacterium]
MENQNNVVDDVQKNGQVSGNTEKNSGKHSFFDIFKKTDGKKKKLNVWIFIVAILAAVCVFFISEKNILSSLDFWLSDLIHQPDNNPTLPIMIVGIDEKSIEGLKEEYGSVGNWPRDLYAKAIENLNTCGPSSPSVIAMDILFDMAKDPETDQVLADTCAKYGNVVTGYLFNFERKVYGVGEINEVDEVVSAAYPYDALRNSATLAFTNNSSSINVRGLHQNKSDDYPRRIIPFIYNHMDGTYAESFSLVTYKAYMEKIGSPFDSSDLFSMFKDNDQNVYFTYTTGNLTERVMSFDYYVSFIDAVNGSEELQIPNDDEIVLIGAYAEGLEDAFYTPANRKKKMNGVEIHANTMEAIAKNTLQVDANNDFVSVLYALITACLIVFAYLSTLPIAGTVGLGVAVIDEILSIILYKNGIYLKTVYLIIPIILTLVVAVIMHYLSAKAAKDKINNAFKMYVAPEVVDEMAGSGNFELKLGGQTKDIAVLFIDIRGFTTMSEGLEPEEVVSILNEYFGLVTDAIFKNKGTLDKFIGDAAMAVFNSPNDLDDYEYRAVHTAWDIALGSQELAAKLLETHGRTINYGIGVNCGPATVGNIGSSFRMDYTAIGDTVNTSARLEANAKAGQILISEAVYERTKDWLEVEDVGPIPLKGKSKEIKIFNVIKVIDKPGYVESQVKYKK